MAPRSTRQEPAWRLGNGEMTGCGRGPSAFFSGDGHHPSMPLETAAAPRRFGLTRPANPVTDARQVSWGRGRRAGRVRCLPESRDTHRGGGSPRHDGRGAAAHPRGSALGWMRIAESSPRRTGASGHINLPRDPENRPPAPRSRRATRFPDAGRTVGDKDGGRMDEKSPGTRVPGLVRSSCVLIPFTTIYRAVLLSGQSHAETRRARRTEGDRLLPNPTVRCAPRSSTAIAHGVNGVNGFRFLTVYPVDPV
jgi:hypothetical protein